MKFLSVLLLVIASCVAASEEDVQLDAISESLEAPSTPDKAFLNAPAGVWTYVSFPGTTCRDGSASGLNVRRNPSSNKVIIYMEGGGICADPQTCFADNPANNDGMREDYVNSLRGIFDFTNPANPIKDWNVVYVPYCSGDLHAGDRRDFVIQGVGTQQFQGRNNLLRFLQPIAKLVKKPTDVVLTGASAGGFGAVMSFKPVQDAFGGVKVRLIDDSGPFLDSNSFPPCLQRQWRTTFGWDKTFLDDCGKSCASKDNYIQSYALWLAKKYDDRTSGLIETAADAVISNYLGIGLNDCTGALWSSPIPTDTFTTSLLSFRKAVKQYNYSTYYPASDEHTFLETDNFYTSAAAGKSLLEWFTRVLNNKSGGNAGP